MTALEIRILQEQPVGRGGAEQNRDPIGRDAREQGVRSKPVDQRRTGTHTEREHQQPAQAERERQRRMTAAHIIRSQVEHVAGIGIGRREHVGWRVRRAFRRTGAAGRIGDHRNVAAGNRRGIQPVGRGRRERLE